MTPRSERRSPRKTGVSRLASLPSVVVSSVWPAAAESPGRAAEVGVRGGEPADGSARRRLPASLPPRAQRPGRLSPQRTRRASVRRVWRRGRHCACAAGRGARPGHPAAPCRRSLRPARSLGISGAPGAPCLLLAGRFHGDNSVVPGDGGPWRPLLPGNAVRTRGAAGAVARGARCGGRAGSSFPSRPPYPDSACWTGRGSGASTLYTCPGPRQAFPPPPSLLPGPASAAPLPPAFCLGPFPAPGTCSRPLLIL